MTYVVVFRDAAHGYAVGPFDSRLEAAKWAREQYPDRPVRIEPLYPYPVPTPAPEPKETVR